MFRHLFALSLGLVACAASAETIVPAEWAKKFTVSFTGYAGTETLTDFPALVRLSTAIQGFDYSDFKSTSGGVPADLAFADGVGNALDYEIDTWNPAGESLVWVRIPSLSSSTVITAYYGQTGALANPERAQGVWKNGYAGVWHMNTDSTLGTANVVDSTGNGFHAQAINRVVQGDGILGKSFHSPGRGDSSTHAQNRVSIPSYNSKVTDAANFTVSGWFKHDLYDYKNGRRLFCHKPSNSGTDGWEVYMNTTKTGLIHVRGSGKENTQTLTCPAQVDWVDGETPKWFHLTVVYRGNFVDAYANGVRITAEGGSAIPGNVTATANTSVLGVLNYGNGGAAGMQGWTDEVRVSQQTFSAARAKAEYDTMVDAAFVSYSAVELAHSETEEPILSATVATEVVQTGFTANGQILSFGSSSELELFLDYGTSEKSLMTVTLPVQTQTGFVSYTLTGLMPGTAYVYRFRAQAGSATVESRFAEVTTIPGEALFGPVTVVTNATSVQASVALTQLAVSDAGTEVELFVTADGDYPFETSLGSVSALEDAAFVGQVDGLLPSTDYTVRFKATGVCNDVTYTSWSEPVLVTTFDGRAEFGTPTATVTADSITMGIDLVRPAAGITTVSLWFSENGTDYTCLSAWSNITEAASFEYEKTGLAAGTTCSYYFKADGSFTPEGSDEPYVTEVASSQGYDVNGGVITWIGSETNASWRVAENWDKKVMPNGFIYDVVIDKDVATTSRVELVGNSTFNSWQLNSVNVGEGCNLQIAKSGSSVSFAISNFVNSGYVNLDNSTSGNSQTYNLYFLNEGTTFNERGAVIECDNALGGSNRGHMNIYMNGNVRNDGEFRLSQLAMDRRDINLHLQTAGTFINNGEILIKMTGNHSHTDDHSRMVLDSPLSVGSTNVFEGVGRIVLDMDERAQNYQWSCAIEAGDKKTQTLVNGPEHTITGTGRILDLGMVNHGLIRGIGVNGSLELTPRIVSTKASESGTPFINDESGRIVAVTTNGVFIGNGGNASTVINRGLLEARTDSFIQVRDKATTSLTTTPAATLNLGGTLAGGGAFRAFRPIVLDEGAIIRPGDLTLNAQGEADGLGASTVGTLSFSTNLTVSAGAELDLQFVSADSYDCISCDGDLVLSGVFAPQSAPATGTYPAVFMAKGAIDASRLTFRMPRGVATPKITTGTYVYEETEEYEVEEEVEVPVEGGEEGETKTEMQPVVHTRTVQKTGNCLNLTIVKGCVISIR